MNLSVKSKIFYPIYGAGWIISRKLIDFNGEEKEYLEFKFIESNLIISTPIQNLKSLGIRPVNTLDSIKKALLTLKKRTIKKPKANNYNDFIKQIDELVTSNDSNAFVQAIQYCRYIKQVRINEGRLIPSGIINNIKKSFNLLIGEYAVNKEISFEKAEADIKKTYGLSIEQLLN